MQRSYAVAALAAAVAAASIAGCARPATASRGAARLPGRIIHEETIQGYGVTNAWEVLRKTGYFLVSRDDGPSGGTSIRSKRGKTSFLLTGSDVPKVLMDGSPIADLRLLRDVPANSIAWIQVLNGIDGTIMEGTNAGGGVILIVTKAGS